MNPSPGVIRTPDQRIRVFISSTLKELAPERRVTRAAVERLAGPEAMGTLFKVLGVTGGDLVVPPFG